MATSAIKLCTDVMAYSTDAYQAEIEHEEHYGHFDVDPDGMEEIASYYSESNGLVPAEALHRCTQLELLKSDGGHCLTSRSSSTFPRSATSPTSPATAFSLTSPECEDDHTPYSSSLQTWRSST